jgi:hypothetical protein
LYEKYRGSGFTVPPPTSTRIHKGREPAQLGMRSPGCWTGKKVSRMYDLSTMPSTILIDRDGRVRYVHRGYRSGYEDTYDKQIRELLRE